MKLGKRVLRQLLMWPRELQTLPACLHAYRPTRQLPLHEQRRRPCPPVADAKQTALRSPITGMLFQCAKVLVKPSCVGSSALLVGMRYGLAYRAFITPRGQATLYFQHTSSEVNATTSTITKTILLGSVRPLSTSVTPTRTMSPTSSTSFPCAWATRFCILISWHFTAVKAALRRHAR